MTRARLDALKGILTGKPQLAVNPYRYSWRKSRSLPGPSFSQYSRYDHGLYCNKKLLVTSATLVVTGALLVVTRSY